MNTSLYVRYDLTPKVRFGVRSCRTQKSLVLLIPSSMSTPYNPRGNGQVERYNGMGLCGKRCNVCWKIKKLDTKYWEVVLPQALHLIRSLLCTFSFVHSLVYVLFCFYWIKFQELVQIERLFQCYLIVYNAKTCVKYPKFYFLIYSVFVWQK